MNRIFMVISLVFISIILTGCTDTSDLESRIGELEKDLVLLENDDNDTVDNDNVDYATLIEQLEENVTELNNQLAKVNEQLVAGRNNMVGAYQYLATILPDVTVYTDNGDNGFMVQIDEKSTVNLSEITNLEAYMMERLQHYEDILDEESITPSSLSIGVTVSELFEDVSIEYKVYLSYSYYEQQFFPMSTEKEHYIQSYISNIINVESDYNVSNTEIQLDETGDISNIEINIFGNSFDVEGVTNLEKLQNISQEIFDIGLPATQDKVTFVFISFDTTLVWNGTSYVSE